MFLTPESFYRVNSPELAERSEEAGLFPMGKGAICAATVLGVRTVHRVGPQATGSVQRVLSVRHSAGQRRYGAW